ncbi:HAD-IIIC family phosphatase [Actinomadura macrotermitis]|uniref:HAD-IIIC family phosphatase n=1 Tax=Actinomadura macrotermitis TaxID=2585200 RepID=A0A7K0BZ50_9ACTN|nr:HAD-IIIC family phosphatase [Actinomadura macrotermitis]MQY06465.1 hypothetical protein [Actinomadura macrotermitis]
MAESHESARPRSSEGAADTDTILSELRAAVADGGVPDARVRGRLAALSDPQAVRRAGKVLARMPEGGDLRPARIAVLGTATPGSYEAMLRVQLVAAGVRPGIEVADYGAFEMTLAGRSLADADVVSCVLDDGYFLGDDWSAADVDGLIEHFQARLGGLRELLLANAEAGSATFVLHTVPLPARVRDSVIGWRDRARLSRAWHELNAGLLGLAEHPRIAVTDLVGLLADAGVAARDDRLYRFGDMPYTDGALLVLAKEVRRFVQGRLGLSRKVLALDLDNTLWGGVIGEVGAAGVELGGLYPGNCYQELQRTAARLREQGVVLVLLSKNDADAVEEALAEHPEMVLRADAFSARVVNWAPKVDNLKAAAEALNLSPGSFVFLDDSAFERGHVTDELPEVVALDSGGDPAHIERTLLAHGWFDVPELTGTDRDRPKLYRDRVLREDFASGFGSSEDYLAALEIEVTAEPAGEYSVPRIAQLAARTNQFNLTGRRFDAAETTRMAEDAGHLVASFAVKDRFGDEGVIGAAWVECGAERWRVLNLVLSCRVLGRGVELAIADWIVGRAREAGARVVEGEFEPSPKNRVSADFWERAGFEAAGDGVFTVDVGNAVERPKWITLNG